MNKPTVPPALSSLSDDDRETELRDILRRCSPQTIDAAIRFQRKRNPDLIHTIVLGIMAWFLDKSFPDELDESLPDMRIAEDLGIDSLLLLEMVIVIEDVFAISIPNQDLRNLTTFHEVTGYIGERSLKPA